MHIMVVDDDASSRYLLDSVLTARGHEVSTASNGQEALEVALLKPLDLVISDILMPGMDGYRLCIEWQRDPQLSGVPFIFYSATYTDAADEAFALSLGADAFLRKPMQTHELVHAIEGIKRRSATRGRKPTADSEDVGVLREYNDRLVAKLEKKVSELQTCNHALENALELLTDEVAVKDTLIVRLNEELNRYSK